ncbi:MAG TPA: hypothetical protein VLM91_15740 [Candidatus Methylomirabilis sp.]|nr:hypothetical protein [Candidatus Methylomirabilis sp.]
MVAASLTHPDTGRFVAPLTIGGALGASLAFMLLVSTPPNAIVYGSGMIRMTKMISTGLYFDIASIIVVWTGLRLLLPLLGLP